VRSIGSRATVICAEPSRPNVPLDFECLVVHFWADALEARAMLARRPANGSVAPCAQQTRNARAASCQLLGAVRLGGIQVMLWRERG
jgi:hypothetical protein